MNPSVSIVVPVYNQASYLAETIRSILAQTVPVDELIVVDDGSTDGSADVARSFGHRLRVVVQANAGQAAALNRGWSESRGELVGYLGADDLYDPTLIATLVERSRGLQVPFVIFPNFRDIDGVGRVVRVSHPPAVSIDTMAQVFRCDIGPGALFSREVLDSVGGWDGQFRQIPDFEFWIRAARDSQFHAVPEVLASWRVHTGSQTFAISSISKAEEPIVLAEMVTEKPWRYINSIDPPTFAAAAYLFSACMHFRSGRFRGGLRRWVRCFSFRPRTALAPSSITRIGRTILHGINLARQ